MLCRTCWLRTKLWDEIWVWKSNFWSPTWMFSQKISAKSVTNTVKDFTKIFWLWKSGTKTSGRQVSWQTIAGHWRGMYLKPINSEILTSLHFRGNFLPVSLVRKVLFCTNRFIRFFETQPDRKILYIYISIYIYIYISEFSITSAAKFTYWGSWAKKVKFCSLLFTVHFAESLDQYTNQCTHLHWLVYESSSISLSSLMNCEDCEIELWLILRKYPNAFRNLRTKFRFMGPNKRE